ncbi:rootletin [Aspergillus nomiae NRRL 13137]|uniref:Rootletin n=1 Tax=Aspergillus nomiae NRRL (strain ATCC 15546 / NRRL 13137 / CBS 260.88 / M93) TaxID=1509407 RepID=A0A0L1J0S2_ASPN3|nr:rootletin [Aspergillus nomiae NRRL 13137]KNG85359.1 rootletin [Aspergillus nomiae NRRL 13137]
MGNESPDPLVGDPLTMSERERDSEPNDIGDDEEMLLLQMAGSNTEPVSPNLKAVLEQGSDISRTAIQNQPAASLVQRPQSSSIDLTAFSFTRPTQHGKTFTFHRPVKQASAIPPPRNINMMQTEQNRTRKPDRTIQNHQSKDIASRSNNMESNSNRQTTTASSSSPGAPAQELEAMDSKIEPAARIDNVLTSNVHPSEHSQAQCEGTALFPSVTNGQLLSPENEPQAIRSIALFKSKINDRFSQSPKQRGAKLTKSCITERLAHEDERSVSLSPTNNKSRVSKHRRTSGKKITSKQPAFVLGNSNAADLSEEDLVQLLFAKMKAREDNDAVASSEKEQMEVHVSQLMQDNLALRSQLDVLSNEIQQKASESRAYKTQIEAWKAKIAKFKYILNELGSGYKALRVETTQLKLTRASLDKDKTELKGTIADTREQLFQASSSVEKSQSYLVESQTFINSMKQALKNAEEKTSSDQERLSDEKKRSALLETYIQDNSRLQAKRIGLIRADQLEMLKKLDSGFGTVTRQVDISQASVQSIMKQIREESQKSFMCLGENRSQERLDIEQCNATVQECSSQIKSLTEELTAVIDKNSKTNGDRTQLLTEQLESVRENVGTESALLKRLAANEVTCISLYERLEACAPSIDKLRTFLESAQKKENSLAQQLEHLEIRLPELQTTETTEPTAAEIKERAELELRLQRLSDELRITDESLRSRATENEEMRLSLLEAVTKGQEAEARANRFESETIVLRDEVKAIESKIREELNRASVISRDQHRVKYEQQIHELLREKGEMRKSVEKVQNELTEAQKALVESERAHMKKQSETECLVLAKDEQIKALESNCMEKEISLAEQTAEVDRLREKEASIATQMSCMQRQLHEANEKSVGLEREIIVAKEEGSVSSKLLQDKLDILQKSLLSKEEECTRIQKELSVETSARLSLEAGKSKAKSEIHTLLRRVQDSEHWVKKIKESLDQVDTISPKEPFSETLNRLVALLQPVGGKNSSDATIWTEPTDGGTFTCRDANDAKSTSITPQGSCGPSENDVVQTTEFIYRTQSFQRSVHSSPANEGLKARSVGVADVKLPCIPDSQQSNSIVPFSSVRQLSPVYSISDQIPIDFAAMLVSTTDENIVNEKPDDRVYPNGGCQVAASPAEKQDVTRTEDTKVQSRESTPLESKDQHPGASQPVSQLPHIPEEVKNSTVTPKTVSFEAHSPSRSREKRKAPDSENYHKQKDTSQMPLPGRTHRRTYSRNRQTPEVRSQEQFAHQNYLSPSNSKTLDHESAERPDSAIKRARVPTSPQPRRLTRADSRCFERKTSPTSLASGSSRHSSMNGNRPNNQRWPTRGGRRTRGDRYSARFNRQM